ncbi:MAG: NADH-quinone oxidoreductase subunit [Thermoleophilaceae bacterium]|jgi:NADH:ubiquinone oxidoreductase subunit E|nr:NADH-quinone oxidoreductase subunit [Thermoleophilaceae bacterium]
MSEGGDRHPSGGGDAPQSGMPDDARAPEGPPRVETLGADHEPGDVGTAAGAPVPDSAAAPPAVPEEQQAVTEDAPRHDLPPHTEHPGAARGWDQAVDLEKDPAVIPDLAETRVPEALRAGIEAAMAKYPDRRSAVIPALHLAQAEHGWCSPEALHQVAAVMRVTPAFLSSIASFYDQFNEDPVGRHHVYVCTSVACMPQNPRRVLDALEREAQAEGLEDTEIRSFECLGACDMAPMASIDGRYVGPLEPSDAPEIVGAIRAGRKVLPGRGLEDSEYRLPWGGRA